jgi:hypothetical protein
MPALITNIGVQMHRVFIIAAASVFALTFGVSAQASTVVDVLGTYDLYLAGQPDGTSCCYFDNAPAESPILAPVSLYNGETLTFSATGGASHEPGPLYATPDGDTSQTYDLHADYLTGISGPKGIHLGGLAGVFLGPDPTSEPAPAQLSGTDFASIAPEIGQIFFIGDGLTGTGSGSIQTFIVPTGATRLFLGITDDGGYYDNGGEIVANITTLASAVPEPSVWMMILAGVALMGAALRFNRKVNVAPLV